jgi:hypothetical protein
MRKCLSYIPHICKFYSKDTRTCTRVQACIFWSREYKTEVNGNGKDNRKDKGHVAVNP